MKVEKRLSSKQYIGKVSGSEPGPGSQLNEGQTITLYQAWMPRVPSRRSLTTAEPVEMGC